MKRNLALILAVAGWLTPAALAQTQTLDTVLSGLFEPYSVAVDTNNHFYITDSANNRILKFSPESNVKTNFAGGVPIGNTAGPKGNVDGPGYLARFSNPLGIVAARGGFIVADSANQQLRLVGMDSTVSTIAGGTRGFTDGNGTSARFNSPVGVAADSAGNIYIADLVNNAIRLMATNNDVTTLASGFLRPSAVAVNGTNVYVADSGNNSIRLIETQITNVIVTNIVVGVSTNYTTNTFPIAYSVSLLACSGSSFLSGNNDSLIATQARFNNPRGLLWVDSTNGLLVADSDNAVLRRVFFNAAIDDNSVETLSATVGGGLLKPVGLARDNNGDFLIVDAGANSVRRLASTTPQPAVRDPVIGTVALVLDPVSGKQGTVLTPVAGAVFNNDVVVAILPDVGTETFYTKDGSDPSTSNGTTPPPYANGNTSLPASLVNTAQPNAPSDITIKAISTATGRRASAIVTARIQFQVANPAIIGNNPGSVTIECTTTNAVLYYTTDGSDPTTSANLYALGEKLNIVNGTNDVTLKVRAFRNGYDFSRVVSQTFTVENLQNSKIGVPRDFTAGDGSMVVVPVVLNLTSNDVLKSLQFRVEVAPVGGGATPISSGSIQLLPMGLTNFLPLPPVSTNPPSYTVAYTSGSAAGVAIGYVATQSTNSNNPDFKVDSGSTLALVGVCIPTNAPVCSTYSVGIKFPSGTSDGFQTPVVIEPEADRTITVNNVAYIVGDTAIARGYNAIEFGNTNLNNNDVNNAWYAALKLRYPFKGTDLFDAMDAYPEDIAGVAAGDGTIDLSDVSIIFDRSLRLSATNWKRVRTFTTSSVSDNRSVVAGTLGSNPQMPGEELTAGGNPSDRWHKDVTLTGGQVGDTVPGSLVSVPLQLSAETGVAVSGLMFRAAVTPVGDAPPLASAVQFVPAAAVPAPAFSSLTPAGVACGWIPGSIRPPLVGNASLGSLQFTVPSTAKAGQSYTIRFWLVNAGGRAANNRLLVFKAESLPGSVWVLSPVLKTPEVISDEWRVHFFGSLLNPLADALADPDGDGKNNLQEFLAGTKPTKLRFHALLSEWRNDHDGFLLKWIAESGKTYLVQSTSDLASGEWTTLAEITGMPDRSDLKEFLAARKAGHAQFYRIVQKPE